jgi:DnaJ-class molecular chaperone
MGMKLRIIIVLVIGAVIIGGAMSTTAIKVDCDHCNGEGKIICENCNGVGALFLGYYWVDISSPSWGPVEGKKGYYQSLIGVCPECEGTGGKICPYCSGSGILRVNEVILNTLNISR